MKPHYRAIFLSDTHLGTHRAQTARLAAFLNNCTAGEIYLVGDILDLQAMRLRTYWDRHATAVLEALLRHLETTPTYYVLGNHDAVLSPLVGAQVHPNLSIVHEAVHRTLDKRQLLVIHGHTLSERVIPGWLEDLAGAAYDVLTGLSGVLDRAAASVALSPPRLVHRLKMLVPGAERHIDRMVWAAMSEAVSNRSLDGCIFGHIHVPTTKNALRSIGGVPDSLKPVSVYNTGDWVENCTALVEHTNGVFELIRG